MSTINFSWSKSWFSRRRRELETGEPILRRRKCIAISLQVTLGKHH
nr:hypothetical protein [Saccharolobus solfataricus]